MSTRTQPAAVGLAREADLAAVQDQPQREAAALLGRDERVEVELGLHRVGLVGELEPARQPADVGVDRQAGQVERHRAHDVAGLAPDARQLHEVVELGGHLAVEVLVEHARHAEQVLRLRAEEPGRSARGARRRRDRRARGRRASGTAANSAGVTLLTFSSVVCAERIVAARSWNAFVVHQRALGVGVLLREAARCTTCRARAFATSRPGHRPYPSTRTSG